MQSCTNTRSHPSQTDVPSTHSISCYHHPIRISPKPSRVLLNRNPSTTTTTTLSYRPPPLLHQHRLPPAHFFLATPFPILLPCPCLCPAASHGKYHKPFSSSVKKSLGFSPGPTMMDGGCLLHFRPPLFEARIDKCEDEGEGGASMGSPAWERAGSWRGRPVGWLWVEGAGKLV